MTDPNLSAIDRVFDVIDKFVDQTDRVLNRAKHTEDQHRSRTAKRAVIDTAPAVKKAAARSDDRDKTSSPVTSTALASAAPRFRIVEAIAAESGRTIFVVTNGTVRAECTTRELAEKILRGLTS